MAGVAGDRADGQGKGLAAPRPTGKRELVARRPPADGAAMQTMNRIEGAGVAFESGVDVSGAAFGLPAKEGARGFVGENHIAPGAGDELPLDAGAQRLRQQPGIEAARPRVLTRRVVQTHAANGRHKQRRQSQKRGAVRAEGSGRRDGGDVQTARHDDDQGEQAAPRATSARGPRAGIAGLGRRRHQAPASAPADPTVSRGAVYRCAALTPLSFIT